MLLVGMLDSPYVRRAAITATLMGLDVEHRSVSVFRHMEAFRAINPLIKAPTLVADDGTVLTDSLLIIQHFEDMAESSLRPVDPAARLRDLSLTGIAMVAADKAVAVEYERKREPQQQSPAWMARIENQLDDSFRLLDTAAASGFLTPTELTPSTVAAAVAHGFAAFVTPHVLEKHDYPALRELALACEALDAFKRWPIDRE